MRMEAIILTDFTITHRIEAPELVSALNNIADALKNRPVATSTSRGRSTRAAQDKPAAAPVEAPTTPDVNPSNAPVTNTVNGAADVTTNAPTPSPVANAADAAPVTGATSNPPEEITFEAIAKAGTSLMDEDKMPQLMLLLKNYGVDAVTQLPKEKYADFARDLRALGAAI